MYMHNGIICPLFDTTEKFFIKYTPILKKTLKKRFYLQFNFQKFIKISKHLDKNKQESRIIMQQYLVICLVNMTMKDLKDKCRRLYSKLSFFNNEKI